MQMCQTRVGIPGLEIGKMMLLQAETVTFIVLGLCNEMLLTH